MGSKTDKKLKELFDQWEKEDKQLDRKSKAKIMVFDERIDCLHDQLHFIYEIKPKDLGYCLYHNDGRGGFANDIRHRIHVNVFLADLQICFDCLRKLYGGGKYYDLQGNKEIVPDDPFLEYLNEIDPMPTDDLDEPTG